MSFDIFLMDFFNLLLNLILIEEFLDHKILFGHRFIGFFIFKFDVIDYFLPRWQDLIELIRLFFQFRVFHL